MTRWSGGSGRTVSSRRRGAGGGSASPEPSKSASCPGSAAGAGVALRHGLSTGGSGCPRSTRRTTVASPTVELQRDRRVAVPRLVVEAETG